MLSLPKILFRSIIRDRSHSTYRNLHRRYPVRWNRNISYDRMAKEEEMIGKLIGFLGLTGAVAYRYGLKGLAAYSLGAYLVDVPIRRNIAAQDARSYCDGVKKPLLNIGAGGGSFWTDILGPTLYGDVNMDISAPEHNRCHKSTVCYGDAHDLSKWPDKHFGAVLATHVLEHLADPVSAMREWRRVADRTFVVVPKWWAPHTWLYHQHYWYIDKDKAYPLWKQKG